MDNNCNKVHVKINRCRKTTIRSKSIIESKQNDKNNQYDNDTIDHHSKKLNSISFTRKIIDIQHDDECLIIDRQLTIIIFLRQTIQI
ncbi:hypothetical protein DERP_005515 [Dermatophagoides pteronyssinus]|uniref:Uncharacterized protein n=1 Tax=Dermatophagoides pteronyssinus TaxID=6956 RepID=A0ABQ8JNA6_DERPT|nr:hypothetical protein DERP_005515 [Dermatophagoides pteronyssinus]